MKKLNQPFYLTGGTALSRHYFNHRFSDDLDLFVNNDANFNNYTETLYKAFLEKQEAGFFKIDNRRITRSKSYIQFFITKKETELRIDFVNDIALHYGGIIEDPVLGKTDSLRNILSNKLSSVFRYEPKDIADIWVICKNFKCHFNEIINEAKSKEAGVDPVAIFEIISSFPIEKLSLIKWVENPDSEIFKKELLQIAEDILYGRENSLSL